MVAFLGPEEAWGLVYGEAPEGLDLMAMDPEGLDLMVMDPEGLDEMGVEVCDGPANREESSK